ncbi:MAG: universal stress protein [Desulfobacterales bacterium]|nr:universal stress protein [Desulfobacterales bacterium]NNL41634.1 universal stress protein [Desulfobacterales bacterium]
MTLPKVEIKNILYATDLSENARYAFAYALSLANLYGAQITFLHVLPEVSELADSNIIGYISADRWEEIKAQHFSEAREAIIGKKRNSGAAKAVLDQFSEDAKLGPEGSGLIADDIIVERGNPVEQILKQAEEKKCDLIVMGTHGQGTLEDVMMGSTARRVLRRSKKPVLVIRLP